MGLMLQPVPAMFIIILTCLMFQLQKISLMILTVLTAPLGIIGVSLSLLLTQRPIGFVAELGILALSGMIIRNSVILIDQIEQHIRSGERPLGCYYRLCHTAVPPYHADSSRRYIRDDSPDEEHLLGSHGSGHCRWFTDCHRIDAAGFAGHVRCVV